MLSQAANAVWPPKCTCILRYFNRRLPPIHGPCRAGNISTARGIGTYLPVLCTSARASTPAAYKTGCPVAHERSHCGQAHGPRRRSSVARPMTSGAWPALGAITAPHVQGEGTRAAVAPGWLGLARAAEALRAAAITACMGLLLLLLLLHGQPPCCTRSSRFTGPHCD